MRLHKLLYLEKKHIQISILIIFFTLQLVKSGTVPEESRYEDCKPRNCGSGPDISYPFYVQGAGGDFCGEPAFEIVCMDNKPMHWTSSGPYIIKNISYENQSILLVAAELVNAPCFAPSQRFAFAHNSPFKFTSKHADLLFSYGCNKSFAVFGFETSLVSCASNSSYKSFVALLPKAVKINDGCISDVFVPVDLEGDRSNQTIKNVDYVQLLKNGFTLEWHGRGCGNFCTESGGRCRQENGVAVCYCPDGTTHPTKCKQGNLI
ncbi:LEAF RUST 10 DISEASE-RESISTANCE LOCUS RECEPTOR-LIKE PROTEIN KINASE-like 1.2 [Ziziphus jujuba]|uniref:non-specific serine/threonine protein kinase n=1 Tax=Ziziphus jujuba TaxID=326968 RepID=A0A6P6GI21_ZIZJJ|nr:LEAF RUST 10 DISEASE-RESISTANCE LOCUS RECEPTOR-LIKE PROTEIN KINASE-like 1.2 [Ziziphus jujuba]